MILPNRTRSASPRRQNASRSEGAGITTTFSERDRARVQSRTLVLLSIAQVLSGLGTGAVVSVGSLLAVELSGSEALAGSTTTVMTLGAALASMPLARFAKLHGRRAALTGGLLLAALGAAGVIVAAVAAQFMVLILSAALLGVGNAVNLQARFAATDLSEPGRRGRDLSIVVWMSTVGAVAGPNLIGVGSGLAERIGIPSLAGLFVIATVGMLAGMAVLWIGLRPDPYLSSTASLAQAPPTTTNQRSGTFRSGMRALSASPLALAGLIGILGAHAVMVGVMSMTPVHLQGHGASVTVIGLTVSLHIAGMYALAPLMGILADRLGGRPVVIGGMVTLLVSVLLAGLSGSEHVVTTLGLILLGLGWSAATVAGSAMIVANVPDEARLSVQGLSDTLMSLAGAVGGALSGLALATIGYSGLGLVSAGVVIGVTVWILLAASRTPTPLHGDNETTTERKAIP